MTGITGTHPSTHAWRSDATARPVVVSVDDGPAAAQAVQLAFRQAAQYGRPVVAVRAGLRRTPALITLWSRPPAFDPAARDDAERRSVEQLLAPWRAAFPDVAVRIVLYQGAAERVLIRYSHTADLVVVGGRRGSRPGRACRRLLCDAGCPVLITPA
jgi:nucleotide-binding universal stress UspA family protein